MRNSNEPLFLDSWLRVKLKMVCENDVEEREKKREKNEPFI